MLVKLTSIRSRFSDGELINSAVTIWVNPGAVQFLSTSRPNEEVLTTGPAVKSVIQLMRDKLLIELGETPEEVLAILHPQADGDDPLTRISRRIDELSDTPEDLGDYEACIEDILQVLGEVL